MAQVICLLRLLGVTDRSTFELANHLAEVPTGEGKSVVIGVLATTVALYGYDISGLTVLVTVHIIDQVRLQRQLRLLLQHALEPRPRRLRGDVRVIWCC